jgi:hypothetical protein
MKADVTAETAPMSTNTKRRLKAEISCSDGSEPPLKQSRGDDPSHENSSTQGMDDNGKGPAGSYRPRAVSLKHPVNIQNAIYAAERLSCSFEVTHSVNFILLGETKPPEPFGQCNLLRT